MLTITPDELLDPSLATAPDFDSAPAVVVDLNDIKPSEALRVADELVSDTSVLIGWSERPLPADVAPLLERFACTLAPHGPGRTWVNRGVDSLEDLMDHVARHPVAAAIGTGLLTRSCDATVPAALFHESTAYSTLLASREFRRWLSERSNVVAPEDVEAPILVHREAHHVRIELNRPDRRNAFGRQLRDALVEALEFTAVDDTVHEVLLSGSGPSFSAGGDLSEFGTAPDPAVAHLVRVQQSAGLALHRVRAKTEARLHGACVGAGIEVPAFAGRVVAQHHAWFCLPELSMGLIPGAGGTVSLPRRIGRWRTAYMMLSGARIDVNEALSWGMIDASHP